MSRLNKIKEELADQHKICKQAGDKTYCLIDLEDYKWMVKRIDRLELGLRYYANRSDGISNSILEKMNLSYDNIAKKFLNED